MRPVYCRKLFELLRYCNVSQQTVAQYLGVSEPSISLWATGQRPLPKRHREAFLTLAGTTIANAYSQLKPILATGIAHAQFSATVSPPDLGHGPEFDDVEFAVLLRTEDGLPEADPLRSEFAKTVKHVGDIRELLREWRIEVVIGDDSIYEEIAQAVKSLRPYFFMTLQELRQALKPDALQTLRTAGTTLTWCSRTLGEYGPIPEVEQLEQKITAAQEATPQQELIERAPAMQHVK